MKPACLISRALSASNAPGRISGAREPSFSSVDIVGCDEKLAVSRTFAHLFKAM